MSTSTSSLTAINKVAHEEFLLSFSYNDEKFQKKKKNYSSVINNLHNNINDEKNILLSCSAPTWWKNIIL